MKPPPPPAQSKPEAVRAFAARQALCTLRDLRARSRLFRDPLTDRVMVDRLPILLRIVLAEGALLGADGDSGGASPGRGGTIPVGSRHTMLLGALKQLAEALSHVRPGEEGAMTSRLDETGALAAVIRLSTSVSVGDVELQRLCLLVLSNAAWLGAGAATVAMGGVRAPVRVLTAAAIADTSSGAVASIRDDPLRPARRAAVAALSNLFATKGALEAVQSSEHASLLAALRALVPDPASNFYATDAATKLRAFRSPTALLAAAASTRTEDAKAQALLAQKGALISALDRARSVAATAEPLAAQRLQTFVRLRRQALRGGEQLRADAQAADILAKTAYGKATTLATRLRAQAKETSDAYNAGPRTGGKGGSVTIGGSVDEEDEEEDALLSAFRVAKDEYVREEVGEKTRKEQLRGQLKKQKSTFQRMSEQSRRRLRNELERSLTQARRMRDLSFDQVDYVRRLSKTGVVGWAIGWMHKECATAACHPSPQRWH